MTRGHAITCTLPSCSTIYTVPPHTGWSPSGVFPSVAVLLVWLGKGYAWVSSSW